MKKLITVLLLMMAGTSMFAQTQIVPMTTGEYDAGGQIAVNVADDSWLVKGPFHTQFWPILCSTGFPATFATPFQGIDAGTRLISPELNPGGDLMHTFVGSYLYRMYFTFANCRIVNSATFTFSKIGGDDGLSGISINGKPGYAVNAGFNPWAQNVSITVAPGDIQPGTNYIELEVTNLSHYTSLYIHGDLKINYTTIPTPTAPVPSFNASTTYCQGDPIVFNASATSGTISSHNWTVRECNQAGTATWGTTWQSTPSGAYPGMYTLPAAANGGPSLTCGKYYKVTLVTSNCAHSSITASRVIYVSCSPVPSFNMTGSSKTICLGNTGGISVNMASGINPANYTLVVTPAGSGPIYTGQPNVALSVNPTATTTYTVTVTDNASGCTKTIYWTIIVNTMSTPILLTGSTPSICLGVAGGISIGIPSNLNAANYTATITKLPSNTVVYSGIPNLSVSLSPTYTTSYKITLVDNTTGCISIAYWTIEVNPMSTPIILKGSSSFICTNAQGGISVGIPSGYNMSDYTVTIGDAWSSNVIYTGPPNISVVIAPPFTTVYSITLVNNITGCISYTTWTVTVGPCGRIVKYDKLPKDIHFYGLIATPEDPNEPSIPGFEDAWFVEELEPASEEPIFNVIDPDCWRIPVGEPLRFKGFDPEPHDYKGDITSIPCDIDMGNFVYGHTYRITRATWSDDEEYGQYTVIMNPAYGKTGDPVVTITPADGPDMRSFIKKLPAETKKAVVSSTELSVYPNPGNGVFNIKTPAGAKSIEVYNAVGHKIQTIRIDANTFDYKLDLSGFAKGIYMLNMTLDEKSVMKKIILE